MDVIVLPKGQDGDNWDRIGGTHRNQTFMTFMRHMGHKLGKRDIGSQKFADAVSKRRTVPKMR